MSTNDPKTTAHNDHNVYILGAGFSVDAGLPLIKGFMNRMRDAAAWLGSQAGRERELEAIDRVLRFRLEATGAAYRVPLDVDNVEELFSLASASGDEDLAAKMPLAIAATLDYARTIAKPLAEDRPYDLGVRENSEWARPRNWGRPVRHQPTDNRNGVPDRWFSCPRHEFYLGLIGGYFNPGGPDRRDTIITFNYDTVIEEALAGLGLPFAYGASHLIGREALSDVLSAQNAGDRLRVLKLHGSINWVSELKEIAQDSIKSGGLPYAGSHFLKSRITAFASYSELRTGGHVPLLVAPTWNKVFSGYLAAIWTEAVQALKAATRVIILGYSMPATDQHFKYLLAAGLQDNISLRKIFFVNPALIDEQKKSLLNERLFSVFRREHFERGIIELEPLDIQQFFAGAAHEPSGRALIGRTLNPLEQNFNEARWVGLGFWQ